MSDLVRVGLLGLGHIAETHPEVLAEREDISLEFTVDPHLGQARCSADPSRRITPGRPARLATHLAVMR